MFSGSDQSTETWHLIGMMADGEEEVFSWGVSPVLLQNARLEGLEGS